MENGGVKGIYGQYKRDLPGGVNYFPPLLS
jgi:hypothetical protein